jgi:hypothetical protein
VSTPELEALLKEAIAFVNAGEFKQGRALLERVLERDPKNDRAWVWLSGCVEDPPQRRICLQQALNANPNNQAALDGMQVLEGKLLQASEAPPSLLESRLSAIGLGNQVSPGRPSPVSRPTTPEMAAVSPVAPIPPRFAEVAEPEVVVEKPRRGRVILLVAVVLLLFAVVCVLVATQVVPILLGTLF